MVVDLQNTTTRGVFCLITRKSSTKHWKAVLHYRQAFTTEYRMFGRFGECVIIQGVSKFMCCVITDKVSFVAVAVKATTGIPTGTNERM